MPSMFKRNYLSVIFNLSSPCKFHLKTPIWTHICTTLVSKVKTKLRICWPESLKKDSHYHYHRSIIYMKQSNRLAKEEVQVQTKSRQPILFISLTILKRIKLMEWTLAAKIINRFILWELIHLNQKRNIAKISTIISKIKEWF